MPGPRFFPSLIFTRNLISVRGPYRGAHPPPELRSRSIFGGSGSGSDPSKNFTVPAPGQFQKAILYSVFCVCFLKASSGRELQESHETLLANMFFEMLIIESLECF